MSAQSYLSLHVPKRALWLLGFLLVAPWIVFGIWIAKREGSETRAEHPAPASATSPAPAAVSAPDAVKAAPGPWGDLECSRILIEPPEEFVRQDYSQLEIRPWFFKGYSEQRLASLWQAAGIDPVQLRYVNEPAHREVRNDGIAIRPDRDLIVGLSLQARTKIYTALGEFPENYSQYNPYRLRTSAATGWLDNADLPQDAVEAAKKLFYPRGMATCFSDEVIILPTIPDASHRAKFIKTLSRKSALMVQLHIAPGQQVDAIADYWGRGGRSKDLRPLLQSLSRRPNGGWIDIVHLVPRFARLHVYTYPLPSENAIDVNHDCHWTSFNFQNEIPDERFSNIDAVRQELMQNYYPVPGEPLLGDLLMFVRPDGVVLHSCVYIADDIVFTKNGPAYSVPWLLATLSDVQAYYAANGEVEIRRFRPKRL